MEESWLVLFGLNVENSSGGSSRIIMLRKKEFIGCVGSKTSVRISRLATQEYFLKYCGSIGRGE
jgi:hypothetical protein